jgi:carboxyl-terminal processing protease
MKNILILFICFTINALVFAQQVGDIKQVNPISGGNRIDELLMNINRLYVDDVKENELIDAAIIGMLEKLDPHSTYISKDDVDDANQRIEGNFVGIGIRFQLLKDTLMVVETIPGGPSEKIGLRAGDRIIAVDGKSIAGVGLKNSQVREKLMGDLGSKVAIDVKRNGQSKPFNFTITRDKIPVNSVDCAYMVAPGIGYIKLNTFARTSHEELLKGFYQLKSAGMESLILDLQGNGGGLLQAAQIIADEFLSENKLIVYSEGRVQPRQELSARYPGNWESGKLVVLVDENSASASEILAGAIQDWDRGILVGRRTFGKGLVQRPIDLSDGSQVRLTIARFFTPTGRFIQKPYTDLDAYENDKINRLKHGELMHLDSIKFPDSLKYKTRITGRTVYGGGGIMPDFFVPLDTTYITNFYRDVAGTGAFNSFSLTYVNENRDRLKTDYSSIENFKQRFVIDKKLMDDFLNYAYKENKKILMNESEYKKSKYIMELRLKATIAQDLFGLDGFYYIFNDSNDMLQKAISILNSKEYKKVKLATN